MSSWRIRGGVALALLVVMAAFGPLGSSRGEELPYRPSLIVGAVTDDRLEAPAGIAIDLQGNVVLADAGMARLQRRTAQGQLLRQWSAFTTAAGTERLVAPAGVAVGSDGSIAVADARRQAVRVFGAEGALLSNVGGPGSGDGGFLSPSGVARDAQNNLYVADSEANRVQKFSPQGGFLLKLGSRGTANGQLRGPRGVAVDRSGDIYVADTDNHRVQKFDAQGGYVLQWGSLGTEDGRFNRPAGIAIDPEGNILVVDAGNGRVQKFTAQGGWVATWVAKGNWVAVDASGVAYVSSPEGRVVRLSSQGQSVGTWGRQGTSDGELRSPAGVALGAQGTIVVADTVNHRIQVFDAQGQITGTWGARGSGEGQLETPASVAVDAQGNMYVADTGNHRVQKFDAKGTFLATWGRAGTGDGEFQGPAAIAVNGSLVFVLDVGNFRVQKFDTGGRFLARWGSPGTGAGQFVRPAGLAVDRGGNTYVADYASGDSATQSVQRFDLDGRLLQRWAAAELGDVNPVGLAVDSLGNLYVTDQPRVLSLFPQAGHDRIVKLDTSGKVIGQVGGAGSDPGLLAGPTGLAVDQDRNIFVADTLNQRVQKFSAVVITTPTPTAAPGVPTPGPTPTPIPVPVGAPYPVSPASGAVLGSLGVTVSWLNPAGTTQYQLQVFPANGDGPGLDLIIGAEAQVRAAAYTIPAPVFGQGPYLMLPDMTYSWRVRTSTATEAITAADPSWQPWSPISTFRTPARSASGVIPVTPQDSQRVTSVTTAIAWRYSLPDVFYYELQVSSDPVFATDPGTARASVWWTLVHGGVTDPPNTWLTPPLQSATIYYWRVRPRVQGDGTPVAWSPTWTFRTAAGALAQPFRLGDEEPFTTEHTESTEIRGE